MGWTLDADRARKAQSNAMGVTTSPSRRFVPYKTLWSPKAAQRQSSRALGGGYLNQERDAQELRRLTHGKRAKRRAWHSGWGEEEDQYLQWQLLFGLGGCPQAGATLTCNFKQVLVPFGIFQLCQRHSHQRQLSLGELRRSQCLHLLPSGCCSAGFCRFLSLWEMPLKTHL